MDSVWASGIKLAVDLPGMPPTCPPKYCVDWIWDIRIMTAERRCPHKVLLGEMSGVGSEVYSVNLQR